MTSTAREVNLEDDNDNELNSLGDEEIMEVEDPSLSVRQPPSSKRKRKQTSQVWGHFKTIPLREDKKERCECLKCGREFLCASKYGTGNLKRHIELCPRKNTRDVGQLLLSQYSGSLSIRSSNFDVEKFRELITIAIVMHDLPFQFVEYKAIRNAFQYCHENAMLVSRNTVKADVLKMYCRDKERIKIMLSDTCSRISLTSDLWTSIATDGYLSLTAHFIDNDWVLQKRILNFSAMPPPHNGVCLAEKIYSLLSSWGIEKKLFTITLDNASANNSFVDMLRSQLNMRDALLLKGEYFHLRCSAHVLNLIVQDGLKEIEKVIEKIRESVKYVRGSQVRKKKFLECVDHMSLTSNRGLRQDVPTRWNSTFLMLDSAIFYRRAFCHLELSDSNYKHCPSKDEWENAEKISEFLDLFYQITLIFSGSKYPTANLFFPSVFTACMTLKTKMRSEDEFIRKMASSMEVKFDKYWSEFSMTLSVAVILDPRYKIPFVEWAYKKLYGSGSLEFQQVRDNLFALFDEYVKKASSSSSSSSLMRNRACDASPSNLESFKKSSSVLEEFDLESREYDYSPQKSQLEMYMDEPRFDRTTNLDILAYWKGNQFRYPELSSMARDILSIPITSVASEAAFSVGGRVLDQYRSSLKPDTVESIICLRDWLFEEKDKETQLTIDELTEDIINLDINSENTQASLQIAS